MSSIRISKEIEWPYVFNILRNKYDNVLDFLNNNETDFIKNLKLEELFNKKYTDMRPPKNLKSDPNNIQIKLNTIQDVFLKKHEIKIKNKSALLKMIIFIYENHILNNSFENIDRLF